MSDCHTIAFSKVHSKGHKNFTSMTELRRYFVCYYHEIVLKRGNRDFFEKQLHRNIEEALRGLRYGAIRQLSGRVVIELFSESPIQEIGSRLTKVFGLAFCCPAWRSSQNMEQLARDLGELVDKQTFKTFKIRSRRANKKFPLTSVQVNTLLGDVIRKRSGKSVDLDNPDLTCHVDIVEQQVFLYFDRLKGSRGLPVSSSGKVVVLMSGGIDSPVAAYKVMKRGCRVIFAHFHSWPHTTRESLDKVHQLVSILSQHQYKSKLYMFPFAELQKQIVAFTPASTRIILYRRMMVRLAEKVARRERAQALVTGDSIGQVSSQTLENLRAVSDVSELPILRPLIGEDKEEIVSVARHIGTFATSILPDVDCCSLFVPRHPEIRAKIPGIRRVEEQLEVEQMVETTWRRVEVKTVVFQDELKVNLINS